MTDSIARAYRKLYGADSDKVAVEAWCNGPDFQAPDDSWPNASTSWSEAFGRLDLRDQRLAVSLLEAEDAQAAAEVAMAFLDRPF